MQENILLVLQHTRTRQQQSEATHHFVGAATAVTSHAAREATQDRFVLVFAQLETRLATLDVARLPRFSTIP